MDKKEKSLKSIICIMISMSIGAGATYFANYRKIDFMNRYPEFLEVDDYARNELEIKPPENPDDTVVADAYFRLYDDKYTYIEESLSPHSAEYGLQKVNNSTTAKESGFKIKFNEKKQPYFSAVVKDMPADRQGIMVGDVVKKIDDYELTDYNHAVRLTGENGKKLNLLIERDGKEMEIDFTLSADDELISSVHSQMYGNTLYISVDSISGEAFASFEEKISASSFDSLILDLRNNGGGYTDSAISIADLFIGSSTTILYAQNGEEEKYQTTDDITYDVPIVVLVNEKTASAAESLSALLKQYGDATLVGVNTFGKGIYQSRAFFNGESVRYTEGYYTVGDWECYNGKGIKPDVEVDMDSDYIGTDKDVQLEKALELLK